MTDKKKLEAKVLSCKRVFNGHFKMDEYEVEMDKHEGGTQKVTRQVFERGHAVTMLGYDPARDEVVLITEMRIGILAAGEYPYTETLPAGGIAKGETDIDTATREMIEETGLELRHPEVIHAGAYVSPGGTSEKISIVFGIVDTSTASGSIHGLETEHENIKVSTVTSDEFMRRIRSGEINDMKTMLAGYWLMENRARLQKTHAPKSSKKPGLEP